MASARFAWGIDVGNRALKAVKLVRDGEQLKIDDFELIEHEHVLSNAGDNKESLIQTALANFVQRHPMKGGVVAVGVAGQSSFARFIKLPPVEEKKIPEIVRFEAIQQIPFPLDDVEWSYQLFRSPDSPDVEVGIFAMRKELIARHIRYFTDFDMNVQVVQINPLAVYNAMYYDQRLKGTTMIIDLGAENTDLIICDNESVWMRSIPIGGNSFTETLVKAFKLPFAKAEDLKRNAATSKYARQIFQAMRPVFADLVAEIQRSIGFYASVHRDSRIKRVLALGGTFKLPGLQKYLQQNLSLDIERLDNLGAGAPSDPKLAATFNDNILSVVSAYGLALQAMGEGKISSSLLPQSIRREKMWKEKVPIFASAAALFCVGTGIALSGYFLQNLRFEAAERERAAIDQVLHQAQQLDSQWSEIESAGATDRALIRNILDLQKGRDLWRNLLDDLTRAIPTPQPPVLEGLLKKDPQLIKQVPRAQRELVTIDSLTSRYVANLGPLKSATDLELRQFALEGRSMGTEMTMPIGGGFATPPAFPGAPGFPAPPGIMGPGFGGEMPTPPQADAGTAAGPRGFILIIRGTTPNHNPQTLIEGKLCSALKSIKPTQLRPRMDYAIVRAFIAEANQIRNLELRKNQLRAAYEAAVRAKQQAEQGLGAGLVGGGGGFAPGFPGGFGAENEFAPRGMGPGFAPGVPGFMPPPFPGTGGGMPMPGAGLTQAETEAAAFKDRLVSDEDVLSDTEFTVVAVVELDPPPYAPPAAAPSESGEQPAASADSPPPGM
ncbi:MAG TPA: type IV pilus assembly protein PilM [Tepidisphaeraceae bacterium]|nr:type IV pilus assembly protein PilM [Tepidisphaeraceae bacterium]